VRVLAVVDFENDPALEKVVWRQVAAILDGAIEHHMRDATAA
jgi:hypothetical protein